MDVIGCAVIANKVFAMFVGDLGHIMEMIIIVLHKINSKKLK